MLKLQGMDKSVKCAYSFICRPWIKCKSSQVSKQTLNRQTNKQINRIGPPTRNLEIKTHWTSFKMPAQTVSVARDCLLMMLLVFRTWKANEVSIIANFLMLLYFYIFLFQIKFLEHFWENSPTIFNFDFTTYWKKLDERGKHQSCSELRPLTMAAGGKMLLERLSWCPLAAKKLANLCSK